MNGINLLKYTSLLKILNTVMFVFTKLKSYFRLASNKDNLFISKVQPIFYLFQTFSESFVFCNCIFVNI